MLRPQRLTKFSVIGKKEDLKSVIELIHSKGVIQLIEYIPESDKDIPIGEPLGDANWVSDNLLKIRSLKKLLNIEDIDPYNGKKFNELELLSNLDSRITSMELEVTRESDSKAKIEKELSSLRQKLDSLSLYSDLGLPLELYQSYRSLDFFVGTGNKDLGQEIYKVTGNAVVVKGAHSNVYAVFVKKEESKQIKDKLDAMGFSEIPVIEGLGDPEVESNRIVSSIQKLEKKRKELETVLDNFKEKYSCEILAIEEVLEIMSMKSFAPLDMAMGKQTFILFGWISAKNFDSLKTELMELSGSLAIEKVKIGKSESIPTDLKNASIFNRLNGITETYSIPLYHEFDPTILFTTFFIIFFGLIVGDVGYGIAFMCLGLLLYIKKVKGFVEFGLLVFLSGITTTLFGLFLYGDLLGIPFYQNAQYPDITWSHLLGVNIPVNSVIDKLSPEGIIVLFAISVLLGMLHLAIGFIISIVNEARHGAKHVMGRFGWLLLLFSVSLIIIRRLSTTPLISFLWVHLFYIYGQSIGVIGIPVPYMSLILFVMAIFLLVYGEGFLTIVELVTPLSNLISYLRIGALAVAKGGLVFEFYVILLPLIFSKNIGIMIAGLALTIVAQLFMFFLGSLSAGIQAIRLNYVEFGTKFFKGGGIKFNPFSFIRKYSYKAADDKAYKIVF